MCDFATAKDLSTLENGQRPRTFVGSAEYVSPGTFRIITDFFAVGHWRAPVRKYLAYYLELLGFDKEIGKYTCFESDLWAAACITYFMLSGLPPFQAQRYVRHFNSLSHTNYVTTT